MRKIALIVSLFAISLSLSGQENDAYPSEGNRVPCQTATLAGTNVSCFGLSDGKAILTINQAGTYNIIWSNGHQHLGVTTLKDTIYNLLAGYYDVQVINTVNGCSAFDIVNITQPALLTATHTSTDVKCFGENKGSVDLTVTGGTPLYSYLWSNGATTADLNNVAANVYMVTVTDGRSCKAYDTVSITQPAQAMDRTLDKTDPTCFGFSNGNTDLTVWGGTPPYVYLWNTGAGSQDLTNIPAGNYSVLITDANACSANAAIMLVNPPLLSLSSSKANNLCFGDLSGSINLTVSGGTLPYNYSWANSDYLLSWNIEDLSGLTNDTYYVTVTDAKGCSRSDSAVITSPAMLTDAITSTDVTTNGGSNGTINLTSAGGVLPHSYLWSNNSTAQNLTGLTAGIYTVTITDFNGCKLVDTVVISEPASPLTAHVSMTHVTCFGGHDGAMTVEATGGTPPYQYLWSVGDTNTRIENLSAGTYSVIVIDQFFDSDTVSGTILQPEEISISQIVTNVSCSGLPDGSIDVTVTGGTPSYTYEWYNSEYVLAALTEDVSGLPADQYYLEVTDTLGCIAGVTIPISQPGIMTIAMNSTDIACAGGATGTAGCTVTGGTLPYVYAWSNGASTPQISGLSEGVYTVTVTDGHSCFVTDSVRISQSDSIHVSFSMQPVSCKDQHDGKAAVYAAGGNGGYTYFWINDATTAAIENLDAGIYAVTVTDIMGCTGGGSVTVTKVEIDCINIPTCFTPNGDGLNDVWVIKDAGLYPAFYMEVFNRWGQSVYRREGSYEDWDGTYEGKVLPAETYYYFIRLDAQSEMMQGTITIVR